MNKFIRYTSAVVLALAAIVPAWFLLNNLQPLRPALYSFALICVLGIIIFLKLFFRNFLHKKELSLKKAVSYKHFALLTLLTVSLLGIFLRLFFYLHYSYSPVSDPMTFYDAGQKLAAGQGMSGNSYATFFPYLAVYDNILGLAMRIIHNPWLATIALNTVFDLGAAFSIYYLIKIVAKPDSKLPLIGFSVWTLSPFNIIFSVLSLPIILVNFFIITTLLLVYLLIESLLTHKIVPSILLACLLGVNMGIGNTLRPIFTVVVAAIFILFIYVLLIDDKARKFMLIFGSTFLLIVTIFFSIQRLDLLFIARETGLSPPSNASGWSIYVGSNSATDGRWSHEDEIRMSQICKDTRSYEDCHKKLETAGFERYKSYGLFGTLSLFVRKLYVFTANQNDLYNANYSIDQYSTSKIGKSISIYTTLYILLLFYLSARFLYRSANAVIVLKTKVIPIVMFIALLLLGFFFSDMFVEAAPRYAQVTYPVFIILAVLSLQFPTPHQRK